MLFYKDPYRLQHVAMYACTTDHDYRLLAKMHNNNYYDSIYMHVINYSIVDIPLF